MAKGQRFDPYTGEPIDGADETKAMPTRQGRSPVAGMPPKQDKPPGGSYIGNVYYSNILPQGKGKNIPYRKEYQKIIQQALQPNATREEVGRAQQIFTDIGYMHPSEIDSMKGKQFMGMARRWNLGPGATSEAAVDAVWDRFNTWKDNIFGE